MRNWITVHLPNQTAAFDEGPVHIIQYLVPLVLLALLRLSWSNLVFLVRNLSLSRKHRNMRLQASNIEPLQSPPGHSYIEDHLTSNTLITAILVIKGRLRNF